MTCMLLQQVSVRSLAEPGFAEPKICRQISEEARRLVRALWRASDVPRPLAHPLGASMRRRLNSIHVSISSISCVCNAGLLARLCVLARFQQMRAEILREITIQAIRPIRPHMTCWNVRPPQSLHSLHSLFSSFHFRFHFLNLCNFAGMQDGLFLRQRIAWQDLLAGHRSVESVENYFVNARERCVEEDALSDAETEFAFE